MNLSRSIDLHNCTVAEAIRKFVSFYNACVRSGYRGRIEVIHGYGSNGVGGTIRQDLRAYLKAHAETFGEYLAGESLRNPGVTILYAKDALAPLPLGLGSMSFSGGRGNSFRTSAAPRKGKNRF
jgi:hypothetical protein